MYCTVHWQNLYLEHKRNMPTTNTWQTELPCLLFAISDYYCLPLQLLTQQNYIISKTITFCSFRTILYVKYVLHYGSEFLLRQLSCLLPFLGHQICLEGPPTLWSTPEQDCKKRKSHFFLPHVKKYELIQFIQMCHWFI